VATRTAIGLDIGTSGVRAAELSFGKHGVTLEKFGQVAVPRVPCATARSSMQQVCLAPSSSCGRTTGFTHKNVIMGVANQRVVVRTVDLPWMPPAELKAALPLQVQDFLPMPVEAAVLDFHALGRSPTARATARCVVCSWRLRGTW
jgi:type IV pilus assembly protein PilM